MNKKTAMYLFLTHANGAIQNFRNVDGKVDTHARSFAWSTFVDGLCKSGDITQRQYDTWSNPYVKKEKVTYEVTDYFDVWGNEEDGYIVNNCCKAGRVTFRDYPSNKQILNHLKRIGILHNGVKVSDIQVCWDCEFFEVFEAERPYPIASFSQVYK
jgi:hypothetical protein